MQLLSWKNCIGGLCHDTFGRLVQKLLVLLVADNGAKIGSEGTCRRFLNLFGEIFSPVAGQFLGLAG